MKILVFGKTGQLARSFNQVFNKNFQVIFVGREEADFLSKETVLLALERYRPNVVINTVAYTAVDRAEEDKITCYKINTDTPGYIAKWCRIHDVILIHYSTDFVFDGTKDGAYLESDLTGPLSVYGMSKRDSENLILSENKSSYIIRTSWVYEESGKNFLNTMIRFSERESIKVVNDQWGSPTYAIDLASATNQIIGHSHFLSEFGIYHCAGSGVTSWFHFAEKIFLNLKLNHVPSVIPVTTEEYGAKAQRPKNSVLSNQKIKDIFGIMMPNWEHSLRACMNNQRKEWTL